MCPSQFQLRSLARDRTFKVGVHASSAISLPVTFDSMLEHVEFSFLATLSVNFQNSQTYSRVETTEDLKGRIRRLVCNFASVSTLFRSRKRDQAFVMRWFTWVRGSPSPGCMNPRYLKCNEYDKSSSPRRTCSGCFYAAFLFASLTNLSAIDPPRDAALSCGSATRPHCSFARHRGCRGSSSKYSTETHMRFLCFTLATVPICQSNRPGSSHFRIAILASIAGAG